MTRKQFWLLITPSVIVMFGFMLVPLYRTLRWSFQKVTYGEPGTGVGLANYAGRAVATLGSAGRCCSRWASRWSSRRSAWSSATSSPCWSTAWADSRPIVLGILLDLLRASARGGRGGLLLAVRLQLRRHRQLPHERHHRRRVR